MGNYAKKDTRIQNGTNPAMLLKKQEKTEEFCLKKLKFSLTGMSKCDCYGTVKWRGETVDMSESRQGVNEQLMKVSEYTDINSLFKILKKTSWGGA